MVIDDPAFSGDFGGLGSLCGKAGGWEIIPSEELDSGDLNTFVFDTKGPKSEEDTLPTHSGASPV
jgi:hypothetical protein